MEQLLHFRNRQITRVERRRSSPTRTSTLRTTDPKDRELFHEAPRPTEAVSCDGTGAPLWSAALRPHDAPPLFTQKYTQHLENLNVPKGSKQPHRGGYSSVLYGLLRGPGRRGPAGYPLPKSHDPKSPLAWAFEMPRANAERPEPEQSQGGIRQENSRRKTSKRIALPRAVVQNTRVDISFPAWVPPARKVLPNPGVAQVDERRPLDLPRLEVTNDEQVCNCAACWGVSCLRPLCRGCLGTGRTYPVLLRNCTGHHGKL